MQAGLCGFNVRLIGYQTPRGVASSHTGLQRRSFSPARRLCAPTGTLYAARASLRTATRSASAQCSALAWYICAGQRGSRRRVDGPTDVLADVPAHASNAARGRCWCSDRNVGARDWMGVGRGSALVGAEALIRGAREVWRLARGIDRMRRVFSAYSWISYGYNNASTKLPLQLLSR